LNAGCIEPDLYLAAGRLKTKLAPPPGRGSYLKSPFITRARACRLSARPSPTPGAGPAAFSADRENGETGFACVTGL
jgi:hypothetical protein